jgi:hypothetical protein
LVATILVFSLAGCAADDVDKGPIEAGILMSMGEEPVGQGGDEADQPATEMLAASDTPSWANDHTLPARIYHLPEASGGIDMPFQDLAIFDVMPESRTDLSLLERAHPSPEEMAQPVETPVAATVSPPSEPPAGGGVVRTSYQIQLGALPSRESAQREWVRIERSYPDLVRDQSSTIIPVELNAMGKVFRLRTGPIPEIKTARSLCRRFRTQGQDCFVVKFKNPG